MHKTFRSRPSSHRLHKNVFRPTDKLIGSIEKRRMKRLSKSFALVELDSYESKQKLLRPDIRVFGIYVGGTMACVEDADLKLTITLSGIPYGTQLKSIFGFIQTRLDPHGIKLAVPKEDGIIVNSFLMIRLNTLQDSIKAMSALSGESLGYSTLLSTFYFGNLRVHAGKYYESVDVEDRFLDENRLTKSIDIMKEFEKGRISDRHRQAFQQASSGARRNRESGKDNHVHQGSERRMPDGGEEQEHLYLSPAEEEGFGHRDRDPISVEGMFDLDADEQGKRGNQEEQASTATRKIEIYDLDLETSEEEPTEGAPRDVHLAGADADQIDSMLSNLGQKLKK